MAPASGHRLGLENLGEQSAYFSVCKEQHWERLCMPLGQSLQCSSWGGGCSSMLLPTQDSGVKAFTF